jgi:hypothetical protein
VLSLALLAAFFAIRGHYSEVYVGPSAFAYFVALSLPHAAVIVGLVAYPSPVVLSIAAGLAFVMSLLAALYAFLGAITASWNFGGAEPPEWYWVQWTVAFTLLIGQLCMAGMAFSSLRRSVSTGYAVACVFGGTAVAAAYALIVLVLFRTML